MTRIQLPLSAAIRRLKREHGNNYCVKLGENDGSCAVELSVPGLGTATAISLRSITDAFHEAEKKLSQTKLALATHGGDQDAFDATLVEADFDRAIEEQEGNEDDSFDLPAPVRTFTF